MAKTYMPVACTQSTAHYILWPRKKADYLCSESKLPLRYSIIATCTKFSDCLIGGAGWWHECTRKEALPMQLLFILWKKINKSKQSVCCKTGMGMTVGTLHCFEHSLCYCQDMFQECQSLHHRGHHWRGCLHLPLLGLHQFVAQIEDHIHLHQVPASITSHKTTSPASSSSSS